MSVQSKTIVTALEFRYRNSPKGKTLSSKFPNTSVPRYLRGLRSWEIKILEYQNYISLFICVFSCLMDFV